MKNPEWRLLSAFAESAIFMTAEMFLSLEPCAIALMFILLFAREEKNFPATPIAPGISSPTAARMDTEGENLRVSRKSSMANPAKARI